MTEKIKVNILLRNKKVKTLSVNPTPNFEFMGGVYVLNNDLIELDQKHRAEVFYFEDNPTPINLGGEDRSGNYLNQLLRINFIEQVDSTAPFRKSFFDELKDIVKNPQIIMILILGGSVLYALWSSGFQI